MADQNLQTVNKNFKQAIAFMVSHHIPPNPANYALCYAYVEDKDPDLQQAINQLIEQQQSISSSDASNLHQQFIASPERVKLDKQRQEMEGLSQALLHLSLDADSEAEEFKTVVSKNFEELQDFEEKGLSLEQVMGLVRSLVKESKNIESSTHYFQNKLNKAREEIDTLKNQLKQTETDALVDALTEILNRRALDLDLANLIKKKQSFSFIICDIDFFKKFNDNYGHVLGDRVLKSIAQKLKECCYEGFKAYRYGGEEFCILCPDADKQKAYFFAEKLRLSIEKLRVKDRRKDQFVEQVTCSFGVAESLKSPADIIERADKMLYQSKLLGRNRVMPICS